MRDNIADYNVMHIVTGRIMIIMQKFKNISLKTYIFWQIRTLTGNMNIITNGH